MAKKLLRTLRGEGGRRRPVWFMRQAGRYLPEYRKTRAEAGSFLDLCYTPRLAEEVTLQPLRRFNLDAAIVFADILLIPDGLGQDVAFREGEGPVLAPVRDAGAVAELSANRLHEHLEPVYETLDRLSSSLPADVALIGFCGAPWTVATYMIEGGTSRDRREAKEAAWGAWQEPGHWFNELMDLLVESSAEYLCRQVEAGAEILQIFDTWASDLAEPLFETFCVEPVARIAELVREKHSEVPIIGFPRGGSSYAKLFCDRVKPEGLGCDWGANLVTVRDQVGSSQVLQGNLDPMCLYQGGEALDREVSRIVDQSTAGKHVFNLGHGILPQTPIEHVERMLAQLRVAEAGEV
ncbi:MAG: uroporphyrinogen decarboxylase [Pseudomonadota bacterium]